MRARWLGRSVATAGLLGALVVPAGGPALAETPAPAAFLDTFDGNPATPQPWRPAAWDVAVHSRDHQTWHTLEPMDAHHGSDCAPPMATHSVVGTYEDAVFSCRDHVMTSINAAGYGVIYLTPAALVDFSQEEAVIRFDVSTLRTSGRDWIDLWITPPQDEVHFPLASWLPDLNGAPRNAVHFRMDGDPGASSFRSVVYRDLVEEKLETEWWKHYEDVLVPSSVRRDTFELRLSRTHVKFGMPQYGLWWVDKEIAPLNWTQGVIQLGHHSYTPEKCISCAPGSWKANTWHWDNVSIHPAVPFRTIHAEQRFVDRTTDPVMVFADAAPEGSVLRFAAAGNAIEVSLDGGQTWQAVSPRSQQKQERVTFSTYALPLPAGTARVHFRGLGGWWGDRWQVKNASVWAKGSAPLASPGLPLLPVHPKHPIHPEHPEVVMGALRPTHEPDAEDSAPH